MKLKKKSDSLSMPLDEDFGFEPFTRSYEKELILKIEQGDLKAKRELIHFMQYFIAAVASKYKNRIVPIEQLFAVANIQIERGLEKFMQKKHYQKYRFVTYITWWIRQGITRELAEEVFKRKKL